MLVTAVQRSAAARRRRLLLLLSLQRHSMATFSSSPPLPTETHSNRFWSAPSLARDDGSVPRLAVLLLNTGHDAWRVPSRVGPKTPPIHASELFWTLWSSAELTVCADGGANRLFDRSAVVDALETLPPPMYIKGDLDSLRLDVRDFYAARGAQVLQDPGQESNDLDKCLELIFDLQQQREDERFAVVIFGALGGRFDQEMQNLNALFRWHGRFQQLTLLSEDTSARLLLPGFHHVIEPNFDFETRTCGLIPIDGPCTSTTTTGLKWNLAGQEMRFGGLISSSNHVDDAHTVVHVENSHPLIWTTELRK